MPSILLMVSLDGRTSPYPNKNVGVSAYNGDSNSQVPWSRPGVVRETRKEDPSRIAWATEGMTIVAGSHSSIGIG